MMDINEINKKIKEASNDTSAFLDAYIKNEDEFITLLSSFNGITSEIYLKEVNQLNEILKFSLLFSDLTIINNTPSNINNFHASYWLPGEKGWTDRNLTIPADLVAEIGTEPSNFLPCYFHRNNEEIQEIFSKYSNLIDNNRLFIRPLRGIMVSHNKTFYYVNPNTINSNWLIENGNKDSSSIILDNGLTTLQQKTLFEITLPYFSSIDINILLKIINDESDLLASFRSSLKQVVKEASINQMLIKEVQNDILNAEVSKLEQKFKSIKNIHKLSVIGSVGTFSLSLVVAYVSSNSFLNVVPLLPTASLFTNEINYQNKITDLKENSMFLLWKISKKPNLNL